MRILEPGCTCWGRPLSLLGGASVGSGTVYWLIIAQFSFELRALSLHQTIYGFKSWTMKLPNFKTYELTKLFSGILLTLKALLMILTISHLHNTLKVVFPHGWGLKNKILAMMRICKRRPSKMYWDWWHVSFSITWRAAGSPKPSRCGKCMLGFRRNAAFNGFIENWVSALLGMPFCRANPCWDW